MKTNNANLQKRGWVSDAKLDKYIDLSNDSLLEYLSSTEPTKRTIAALLIKERGDDSFIEPLIQALCIEKKLYSKIAITEALGNFGPASVVSCIPYLGRIGKNQHKSLPKKPFLKKSYPLPRDIIARTICKAGESAIPLLIENIDIDNLSQTSEGIDAIGYISYYQKNRAAQNYILKLFNYHHSNPLIVWKCLRAMQAFPNDQVISLLKTVIAKTDILQNRWEAKRSLKKCLGN